MLKNRVKLHKRRAYSEEFKLARVKEYETGEFTVKEISRIFQIARIVLYRWIHKYSTYNKRATVLVEMKDSASKRLKDYEKRISELEQALGQKQLKIDFLEKIVELAKERFNIDLKKNSDTPPLTGSSKTKQK